MELEFGYYPLPISLSVGQIQIETLADLNQTVTDIKANRGVEAHWIYAPVKQVRDFITGKVRDYPYAARIFGLPVTHRLKHGSADSAEHLAHHLWALSFFVGMRLDSTGAGFVDSTPIRQGTLVDFVVMNQGLTRAVEIAEHFWVANRATPKRAKLFAAAVHALFIGQNPHSFQYERFIYFCSALDACFKLVSEFYAPPPGLGHAKRIGWMCEQFGMDVPAWADSTHGGAVVAGLRNDTIHEALYMGEPLGFAVHGVGTNQNLPLEMEALICRLLVALIGSPTSEYVTSPITTRQKHGLTLS